LTEHFGFEDAMLSTGPLGPCPLNDRRPVRKQMKRIKATTHAMRRRHVLVTIVTHRVPERHTSCSASVSSAAARSALARVASVSAPTRCWYALLTARSRSAWKRKTARLHDEQRSIGTAGSHKGRTWTTTRRAVTQTLLRGFRLAAGHLPTHSVANCAMQQQLSGRQDAAPC
jgi:hypothetical protein